MSNLSNGKPLICCGCLSAGRNLQQLTHNADLFLTLLNNGTYLDSTSIKDILLCWECVALLQRTKCFQKRIQKAQKYLESHCFDIENLPTGRDSLSCLNIVNNYEIVSTHCKKEEEKSIKVEADIEKEVKICLEVDTKIKEETLEFLDDSIDNFNNTDLYNDYNDVIESTYDIKEESNDPEYKPKIKIKKKKSGRLKTEKTLLDINNIEFYIHKLICTQNNVQALKKENKKSYKIAHYKANLHCAKINSMKSKDIAKLAESGTSCPCSYCDVEITLDRVSSHYEEHTPELYQCRVCLLLWDTSDKASNHILDRHKFVYTCPECSQCFHILKNWRKHVKCHKYICDHCKKEFNNRKRITHHMRLMHLPAECGICGGAYDSGLKLHNHLRRVHVPHTAVGELCYCVECDKYYPHPTAYQKHLKDSVAHAPRRVYRIPCPECGRVFTKKIYMTNHYKLFHLKQTQHYCNICDKYYSNAFGLRTHTRYVHMKEEKPRNKICDICGRAFHNQKILTNHIRTHTGERPYKCPHCPAAFAQRTAMMSHIRTQHKYLK
ncbi:zinc finger protein 37-like [Aricia agestis]|uniref:zinc finger protein 37-like n=1 Tax=Aricia agestis TaxID=91739 RepID=UPI001C20A1FB|nr:zinc finger protein 37-like [Aricia agestis]